MVSARLFEGNVVSVRVGLKINGLPTTVAVAALFAGSTSHDISRRSMDSFEAISGRQPRETGLVLSGLSLLYKDSHTC